MNYQYEINFGSYYLYDMDAVPNLITKEKNIILMCDEVALCFDKDVWVLHKHGKPENVEKWYNNARDKLIKSGADDMANSLIIIKGAFPAEEINKCISNTGYIEIFYKKLIQNKIKPSK
jgi:hypothetical protein